jgi:3-oxoacyl-[acyl-carrier-protein] synthase-3
MSADRGIRLAGLGTHLPAQVRTNEFWPPSFSPRSESLQRGNILAVERSSTGERVGVAPEIAAAMAALGDDPFRGARRRHVIDDAAEPSDLEVEAVKRALAMARLRPDEIDLLLIDSLVPDRLHPSNAPAVQAKCELVNATCWSLDVGCASFQPQLLTARALIENGTYRNALLVFSSAVSRVLDYTHGWSPSFGDGASAALVTAAPAGYGVLGHWSRTDGSLREGVVYAPVVDGEPRPRWDRYAAPIRLVTLDPVGGKSAGLRSTQFCVEASQGALASAGLTIDDVDFFVCNQSVSWLVDGCRRALGIAEEKTLSTFAEVANIGAAVVPYHLEKAWRAGKLKDGDRVLIYSPGAGLTRAAVVLRWLSPMAP